MKKISFIENKKLNFLQLNHIYKKSIIENHHANFGPLTKKLEKYVFKLLNLTKNKSVVACSSGSLALLTIGNYFRLQNKKRFATSKFTFFSNNNNYLCNSYILETNKNGLIDLEKIKNQLNKFDNLIYTNIFNSNPDFTEIYKLCKKNKKNLIIDNALTLFERPKNYKNMNVYEMISFHHTKPWGFGEAGVIICPKKDEKIIRNLTNFGLLNFNKYKKFSFNCKISDLSSAAILLRLKNIKLWSKYYNTQKQRLIKILNSNFEFEKIFYTPRKTPSAYIPVVAKENIEQKLLNKTKYITLKKYYVPISNKRKKNCYAETIYNKIVCIPCHAGMAKVSDKNLIEDLKKVLILKNR